MELPAPGGPGRASVLKWPEPTQQCEGSCFQKYFHQPQEHVCITQTLHEV